VSWAERRGGSHADYEAAQERVLALFGGYQMPETLRIEQFLVRVGEFGGYMVVSTEDVKGLHQLTSTMAVFQLDVEPVLKLKAAIAAEVAAIEYRKTIDAPE